MFLINPKTFHTVKVAQNILLEAQENNLKPEPGQYQHQHHVGESKAEPAGEVDHTTVVGEEPSGKMERRRDEITKGRMNIWNNTPLGLFVPYWSIWPLRMRFGVVPVSVAVPPMLAE